MPSNIICGVNIDHVFLLAVLDYRCCTLHLQRGYNYLICDNLFTLRQSRYRGKSPYNKYYILSLSVHEFCNLIGQFV